MSPRIVYEDELVTEYDDGTEEVRFTPAEYEAMAADPATFGLACRHHGAGPHWLRDHQLCLVCEVGPDDYPDDDETEGRKA